MVNTKIISSEDSKFVDATNEVDESITNSGEDNVTKKNLANSWATLADKP